MQCRSLLTKVQLCQQGSLEPLVLEVIPVEVGERSLVGSSLPFLEEAVYAGGDGGHNLFRFEDSGSLLTRLDLDDLKDLARAVVEQEEDKGQYILQAQGE